MQFVFAREIENDLNEVLLKKGTEVISQRRDRSRYKLKALVTNKKTVIME